MRRTPILRGLIATIFAMGIFGVFIASKTNAQTVAQPQFFFTWQASNSYAPSGYAGKILPNTESLITASVTLIANGHPIDLSNQTIYWYLNDAFIGGGIGQQDMTFRARGDAPDSMVLRVELPDYPGGLLIYENTIPLVQPIAVIEAPYPSGDFSGGKANLQGLPYFFNTTSSATLSFAWTVNGQAVTSALNPQSLQISLPQSTPAGYAIAAALTIQKGNDTLMTANGATNLTYQSQL